MRRLNSPTTNLLGVRQVQTFGPGVYGDGAGLYLRVSPTSANFVFRFTSPAGKRREMGLGVAHRGSGAQAGQSLTYARELAAEARQVLQKGLDPLDERNRLRDAARTCADPKDQSLGALVREHHTRVVKPKRTERHGKQWLTSLENHLGQTSLWTKPIQEITAPELLRTLLAIKPHPRARNIEPADGLRETVQRIRQRLDVVWDDAIFDGLCEMNAARVIKRRLEAELPERQSRKFKMMPYEDMPAFMSALRQQRGTAARALEFLILTAARTGEVIGATPPEIRKADGLWVVPGARMKSGKNEEDDHVVYLSAPALRLATEALERGTDYLFPSPMDTQRPLSNMGMLMVLDRMGSRDCTVHGFRATFSTWANTTAAARPDVIEACLAHEEKNRVRAAYNRSQFATERRALLAAWAEYLSPAAKLRAVA